jgi:hypothetical protein
MPRPILLAVLLGLSAWELHAQSRPSLGPDGEVGAVLSIRPTVSTAADRYVPILGLGFGLRLSPGLQVGGEGLMVLRGVRVSRDDSPDRTDLRFGYGGLSIRLRPVASPDLAGWHAGLLLGAGTARIRSSLVGAEVGTENFGVVEPILEYRIGVRENIAISLAGGYRFTPGFDPLPGVEAGKLSGTTLSLVMHLVRDP